MSSKEAAVLEAAFEWVERIRDHPNLWADDADWALIDAVRSAYPLSPAQSERTPT